MKSKAKIFIACGENLLFSIKRSPGKPWKDRKLELLGGGIDTDEAPFQGLIRELVEEEMSGTLARRASRKIDRGRRGFVGDEPHFIYDMTITPQEIDDIRMDAVESYGYVLLHQSEISDDPIRFTPKTLQIFRALGLIEA